MEETKLSLLEVNNVRKTYTSRLGENTVEALKGVNFSVESGEYIAIMGESGSGKTTLLNILAALDRPTSGEVRLNGINLVSMKEKEISAFRRKILALYFRILTCLTPFPCGIIFFSRLCYPVKIIRPWKRN